MARAIWSGAISFGLVNVPVKLYTATSPKTVRFNQLSSKTGARIRQKRVDPTTDEEVPYEDIVKGYEITPDRYVMITNEELEALDPKATRTVDIEEFVDLSEIDPIYYDHNYYLAPTAGGAKAYRLLLDAMRESGKVGIGKVVHPLQAAAVRAAPHRRRAHADHDAVGRRGALARPPGRDRRDRGGPGHRPGAQDGRAADRRRCPSRVRAREVPRRVPRAGARR